MSQTVNIKQLAVALDLFGKSRFARLAGLHRETVAEIAAGKRLPVYGSAVAINRVLQCLALT